MASGIYKSGQGYYTRMGTTVGAMLMLLLGIVWIWSYAERWKLGINPKYVAAGTGLLIFAIIGWFIYDLVFHRPSTGDFLISTEGEMKKVNWSTRREVTGSTTVVIVTMFLVTIFVFAVDLLFQAIFTWMGVIEMHASQV
jgi:preprotein translocase SecE subunit